MSDNKVIKENSLLNIFTNGIFKENNILVTMLGLCPVLAVTQSLEAGFGMGLLVTLVLLLTSSTISLIRKLIPNEVRIPAYILVIATEVTVVYLLTQAYLYNLAVTLGIFIPLITVNCIIFGRAEAFASKNSIGKSALDALGVGIGCLFTLSIAGLVREILGTGGLVFGKTLPFPEVVSFLPLEDFAIPLFIQAPGAFIILAIMLAVTGLIQNHVKLKEKK